MNVWLDVTTIAGWSRPAVGIIRTEAECARHFLAQSEAPVRFCRFEKAERRYYELDRDFVEATLARLDGSRHRPKAETAPSAPAAAAPIPVALTKEQRLKVGLKSLINRLPTGARSRAFHYAQTRKEAFFAAMRAAREGREAMRHLLKKPEGPPIFVPSEPAPTASSEPQPAPFGRGDVVVSLGLDWDQKDLPTLYEIKQRLDLKVVLFCYDIIPVRLPHLCVGDVASIFGRYFADLAWCADKVLCISDYSRRDLAAFLGEIGAPTPEMAVVRLGSELPDAEAPVPSAELAPLLEQRYVLFVSTIERRKNHETLYRAYTRLIDRGMTDLPLLVFVGMPGWGVHDLMLDLKLDPRIKPYLRIFNNLSDDDLGLLYRNAYFTAFPSLFEGWGLPVAESLSYGKFCLASHSSSIPEVGGDLLEYLDPWDVGAWTERLAWYFTHPEAVAAREERIKANYRPTRWSETGRFVLDQAVAAGEAARRVGV
ncbi:MAG: glycosyltransferase family 4 protein [Candidatus Sericytochromatia bacterium]